MSDYPDNWDQKRRRVYKRDQYECQQCGSKGGNSGDTQLHAHHRTPISKGGSHEIDNLTTVCHSCHEQIHGHRIPTNQSSSDSGDDDTRAFVSFLIYIIVIPIFMLLMAPITSLFGGFFSEVAIISSLLLSIFGARKVITMVLGPKELSGESLMNSVYFCKNCKRGVSEPSEHKDCPHCGDELRSQGE